MVDCENPLLPVAPMRTPGIADGAPLAAFRSDRRRVVGMAAADTPAARLRAHPIVQGVPVRGIDAANPEPHRSPSTAESTAAASNGSTSGPVIGKCHHSPCELQQASV